MIRNTQWWFFVLVCMVCSYTRATAQDTLTLKLSDAERLFADSNLLLLAQQYNINAAKAQIIRAKAWDNPTFTYEQMLVNQNTKEILPVGKTGQYIFQAEQLLHIAGQRNNNIKIEKINAEIAGYQFYDLLRTLRYQLRRTYVSLYYKQQSLKVYNTEIGSLENLVALYQEQYTKGNVPFKDVLRLTSFQFQLETEQKELLESIRSDVSMLKVLIGNRGTSYIVPDITPDELEKPDLRPFVIGQLLDTAAANRYDLKSAQASIRLESQNLKLQKSMAVPDLTVGYVYDKAGSYINNYHAMQLSIPIPLWNQNRGNIVTARNRIAASQAVYDNEANQLQAEVIEAYGNALQSDSLFRKFNRKIVPDFQKLIDGVTDNYRKRNISLLEFLDFYESYKNTVTQMNLLASDRLTALENLSYVTGKNLFTY